MLAVPAPPSPRPPDLEDVDENLDKDSEKADENASKDKEKEDQEKGEEDGSKDSPAAEVDERPQCIEPLSEEPQRIPSPPQRIPSPPSPMPQEQQPMVAVVPNLDGMPLLHLVVCLSYYL